MIVDLIIVVLLVSACIRGREIGLTRQLLSAIGFFGGMLVGALLQPTVIKLIHGAATRTVVALLLVGVLAFGGLALGETLGFRLKLRVQLWPLLNRFDKVLGMVIGIVSVLAAVWLTAALAQSLPYPTTQNLVRESKIASTLVKKLPRTPNIISDLGHTLDPNGFPEVFAALEPNPPDHINLPKTSELLSAVNKDRASVVKITGQGCGGIIDGSGFVIGQGLVATNAHVVAGIKHEYVIDANGTHAATAIWFDPNLDLSLLRVSNLAGQPLPLDTGIAANDTPAAVLGYPGGGGFTAQPAAVLAHLTAVGRNIYGKGSTQRSVYELASDIEQGNSGGPAVARDGSVIGIVFAKAASYNDIGYALAASQVTTAVADAGAHNTPVSTGSCSE